MKVQMQAVNFNAQNDLSEYIEKKLNKLNQLYDKIVSAKVFLKLENSSVKNNKTIEVLLEIPGDDLIVKKTGQSFEEGIDLSLETLKRLVIKRKEKMNI